MRWSPRGVACAVVLAATLASPVPGARAEFQISIYTGGNLTHDSNVTLIRPGGTNATFSNVPWDGKPFETPPYYGGRITYWLDTMPNFGFGIDFTHFKTYARLGSTVGATGTIGGVPVGPNVVLGSVFNRLEFTDGLNLATVHAFYRYPMGFVTPYVGVGLGAAIPHVEVFMAGFPNTFRYEVTGIAARGYAGLEFPIYGGWAVFTEYQLSFAQINNATLAGGGTLRTDIISHHFNFGLSYAFKPW